MNTLKWPGTEFYIVSFEFQSWKQDTFLTILQMRKQVQNHCEPYSSLRALEPLKCVYLNPGRVNFAPIILHFQNILNLCILQKKI